MRVPLCFLFCLLLAQLSWLSAQTDTINGVAYDLPPCAIRFDSIDPFDNLRTVMSEQLDLGAGMISQYETIDGPRIVSEAKAAVNYTENDSLAVLFLQLEMPEYELQRTENSWNVKLKMASDTVIGFYTVSDRGTFSRQTNMRHYQHTALIPTDMYYLLTHDLVDLVRVEYLSGHRRTLKLTIEQQLRLREYFRCVGERVGYYPINP